MVNLSFNLQDKVFVVTGGSRGIGLEIANLLLGQQAQVVICGRKQEGLDAARQELNAGNRLKTIQTHVAKSEEVDRLFEAVIDAFGRIDGLINNVGMNIVTAVVDADAGLWNKIIDSNLNSTFLCSRKAGQIMRDQKKGKIVSISSIAGRRSAPFMGIYGVAKAGIEMLTKAVAQELAPFNIQVNAVAPSMVRTKFSQPFWSNGAMYEQIVKAIPMGRIAEPTDVAWPVLFLCSEASDFITGQTLMVDGGSSAV
ncbi:MAG: SDR family oxidoreductase [Deltaproteobacteria bacterium]|jgi:2-deoxy-D-gluconate 3-dehydrogenase|nr:SDR family oxidoreductase [Deltaproteobacteria bacterium]